MRRGILGAVIAGIAICLSTARALATDFRSERNFSGWSIYFENDLLANWYHNEDRNYTMGVGFEARGAFVTSLPNARLHFGLDKLVGLRPPEISRSYHALMLQGSGFTPDDLTATEPIIGDRPYGSLVLLQTRRIVVRGSNEDIAVTTEMNLGFIGTSVPGDIQTFIHSHNSSPEPQGWRHQISNGGEFTATYRVNADRCLVTRRLSEVLRWFDWTGGGEAWVGYYTNAALTTRVRLGRYYSEFWEFAGSPLSGVAQALDSSKPMKGEFFLFGTALGRVVAYNALLQGQFKHSDYTLGASQLNRVIGEFELGAHASFPVWGWTTQLTWLVLSGRTAEYDTEFSRTHYWAGFYVGMSRPLSFMD